MNNIKKTRTCSYCKQEIKNITPLELAHHVRTCPVAIEEKKKRETIAFPKIMVAGFRHLHPHTPLVAIKYKCMDCCEGQQNEVKLCPVIDCPLWTRRFGMKPQIAFNKGRNVTEPEEED